MRLSNLSSSIPSLSQFTKSDSAMKVLLAMDGRFFGGRVVRIGFYDESRFEANDLLG